MRMTKTDFERLAKSLEGKRIARVSYFESDFGVPGPDWTRDPRFDSIGQGIDLEIETGEIYALMWDNTFFCYGVGVWERSMETGLRGGFNKMGRVGKQPMEASTARVYHSSGRRLGRRNLGNRIPSVDLLHL
jgi:hypothetical protein